MHNNNIPFEVALELETAFMPDYLTKPTTRAERRKRTFSACNRKARKAKNIVTGVSDQTHRYHKCSPIDSYTTGKAYYHGAKQTQRENEAKLDQKLWETRSVRDDFLAAAECFLW